MGTKLRSTCMLAIAALANTAMAIPVDWAAGNDDWFNATNWNPAQVPTSVDDASINNAGTANANATVQVGSLTIGRAVGASNVSGTANITTGDLFGSSGLNVGRTVNNINTGTADGTLNVAGNVSGFGIAGVGLVGFGNAGNATGNVTIGGSFEGNLLQIGTSSGSGDAVGTVEVGTGIGSVGLVVVGGNGSSASSGTPSAVGELIVNAGGIQGTGSDMRIGTNSAPGSAMGTVTVDGGISNFSDVEVGRALLSSVSGQTTGTATGSLNIQNGNLTGDSTGNLSVGRTNNNGDTDAANGALTVAGNVSGFGIAGVGLVGFGNAGNATGNVTIGGSFEGNLLQIGTSSGSGDAVGTVEVGTGIGSVGLVVVGGNGSSASSGTPSAVGELIVNAGGIQGTGSDMRIGTNSAPGSAVGTVTVDGGISNFDNVEVGRTAFDAAAGTASGALTLTNGGLSATNLKVGVTEAPSSAIATGVLDINDNAVVITNDLLLGDGSNVMLDIQGLSDFGNFNVGGGVLGGVLDVDFFFTPTIGDFFDLIVSGSLNGLSGGFDSVNITGLAPATPITFGVALNSSNVEVYRLQIGEAGANVPVPGTLLLFLPGMVALLMRLKNARRQQLGYAYAIWRPCPVSRSVRLAG